MANAEPEKVAIPAKIILKPYRTQKVAKSYLSSEIDYNAADDFLTVTSEGKSHVLTTYKLGASSNSDSIEFDSDPNSRSHCLTADAKVLSSCLSNFGHVKGLTEINLKIQGQKIILRNCVTDIARKGKKLNILLFIISQKKWYRTIRDCDSEHYYCFCRWISCYRIQSYVIRLY